MIFVLSKNHSYLLEPGPTLSTRVISGFNGILIRPYDVSNEWAPVMMIHELVHLDHKISKLDISPRRDEYLAYKAERKSLDIQTENRLSLEQAKLIIQMKLNSYLQVIWHFKNNRIKFQEKLIELDNKVSREKPKSTSELEMRLGFYVVSLSLDILAKSQADEEQGIKAISQILKEIGKY